MTYIKRNLYAYAYNKLNDVYTVRGLDSGEISLEPRTIEHIPDGLMEKMADEYAFVSGYKLGNVAPRTSFSTGRFYAVVDFHNREFTPEQVSEILDGRFVNVPYQTQLEKEPKGVRKALTRFGKKKQ